MINVNVVDYREQSESDLNIAYLNFAAVADEFEFLRNNTSKFTFESRNQTKLLRAEFFKELKSLSEELRIEDIDKTVIIEKVDALLEKIRIWTAAQSAISELTKAYKPIQEAFAIMEMGQKTAPSAEGSRQFSLMSSNIAAYYSHLNDFTFGILDQNSNEFMTSAVRLMQARIISFRKCQIEQETCSFSSEKLRK